MMLPTTACFQDLLGHWQDSGHDITVTLANGLSVTGQVAAFRTFDGLSPQVQMIEKMQGKTRTCTWFCLDHVMSVSYKD